MTNNLTELLLKLSDYTFAVKYQLGRKGLSAAPFLHYTQKHWKMYMIGYISLS